MEIRNNRDMRMRKIPLLLGIVALLCACNRPVEKDVVTHRIVTSAPHTLVALTPEFSLRSSEAALHKPSLSLDEKGSFPMIGILRVDGKSYRFMGGDSLRITPLVPLSDDSCGWLGKYSYLHPGAGWTENAYDDKLWYDGMGAFGSEDNRYTPHTIWGANRIYVRRHFAVDDKNLLKERKLYLRYICDDGLELYCNGKGFFQTKRFTPQLKCVLLDGFADCLKNGDNVIASYGYSIGGPAMMDFGLYMENRTYADAEPATLKKMDVQATQTQYLFQCGDVELRIDFVSPSLSEKWDMTGWPVGFLTYQVRTESGKEHAVEVLFDVDAEWMSGKSEVDSWVERDWRFTKSDSLYLAMVAGETVFSCEDNHIILSQRLSAENENKGVLLVGYDEGRTFQYGGESLLPLWNKDGTRKVKELMMSVGNRYRELKAECDRLDCRWNIKAFQTGNKAFAGQTLPAYRTFMSSHRFVPFSDNGLFCLGDTLGNVREAYESFPTLLFFNRIDWMKGLLNPVFAYCEDVHWVKRYPPYDIGLYPIASKQVRLEDHAVETAADMLMMTAAVVGAEQDFGYADRHWKQLCLWADYLQERMKAMTFPSAGLLEHDDEQVKCVLGLMAYRKLVQLKGGL